MGLDGHKEMIAVAVLLPGTKEPLEWPIANETAAVRRMVTEIERLAPGEVRSCYEVGPLGFTLQRQVEAVGRNVVCTVIVPSLIPVKRGDRIKIDRRDARKSVDDEDGQYGCL